MDPSEYVRWIEGIYSGFQRSQILITAVRGGVFTQLEQPRTAEELARALHWDPRGTRMLLGALLALNLVEKESDSYWNAPVAAACLVPGAPMDRTSIIRHAANGWDAWSRLSEAVATGTGTPFEIRNEAERRDFIDGMNDIAKESVRQVAAAVDLSPYRHLLDLGGGPGAYSIAFLQAHLQMRATIFDLPEVIPMARERVISAGLQDRVRFLGGDLTVDSFGAGYDLALVSNIIHSFDAKTNRELVQKCYDALAPGGMLIIKDFLVDNDRSGPPFSLIFALQMLVRTGGGDTYTINEVKEWTDDAGFARGDLAEITPQTRLWLVRKP